MTRRMLGVAVLAADAAGAVTLVVYVLIAIRRA